MRDGRRLLGPLIVLAMVGGACGGSSSPTSSSATPVPTATATGSTSASGAPEPTVEITGLKANQPSGWKADPKTWSVDLSWDAPVGFVVHHYVVRRNGKSIGTDVTKTTITDGDAEPGATYHYSVVGVDAAGTETKPAAIAVKTGTPPTEDARLAGKFVAKLHITSQGGLQGGAQGAGLEFVFGPTCGSGACSVHVSIRGASGSAVLARSGASYSGTLHAPFRISACGGGSVVETLNIQLRVTAATVLQGEWRANKVEGTMNESASSAGCVTAHIDYEISAVPL